MTCKEQIELLKSRLENSKSLADFRKFLTIDELPAQVKDKTQFLENNSIELRDSKQFSDGVATISQLTRVGTFPQEGDDQNPVVILLSPGGIEELYEIGYSGNSLLDLSQDRRIGGLSYNHKK